MTFLLICGDKMTFFADIMVIKWLFAEKMPFCWYYGDKMTFLLI